MDADHKPHICGWDDHVKVSDVFYWFDPRTISFVGTFLPTLTPLSSHEDGGEVGRLRLKTRRLSSYVGV